MTRLLAELRRLYLPHGAEPPIPLPADLPVVDAGRVRAMVLQLAGPAPWASLAAVWRGVQSDLELPAPGIAVTGTDAHQLWFSLAGAVPQEDACAFLAGLRTRYLDGVPAERIRTWPSATRAPGEQAQPLRLVPAQQAPERWSAFVARDLAALFADEPWLDQPPGDDAQAELLTRLQCTPPAALAQALARLRSDASVAVPEPALPAAAGDKHAAPVQFLLQVMNDATVDMALRVDAAKALLPYLAADRQA